MAVRANPEPENTGRRPTSRFSEWMDTMFRENAMMDEATRYMRQFARVRGSGQSANIVIVGIVAFFYLWLIATMIRYDITMTMPILFVELFIVTLLAPSSMHAAISGEREKATWDALALTRLTPAQIIAGKMGWRVGVVAVLIALAMVSIVVSQFMGDDPTDRPRWVTVIVAQAMIFCWGVLLCAYSLLVSAHTRQTVTTIAVVIGSLLGVLALLPLLLVIFGADPTPDAIESVFQYLAAFVFWMNPFYALTAQGEFRHNYDMVFMHPIAWTCLLCVLYLLAAALFIRFSHTRIRRLEEPVRAG